MILYYNGTQVPFNACSLLLVEKEDIIWASRFAATEANLGVTRGKKISFPSETLDMRGSDQNVINMHTFYLLYFPL